MKKIIRDVQRYIFRYPTIIGIEFGSFTEHSWYPYSVLCNPVIVNVHGYYIFPVHILYMRRQVETDGHNSVFAQADDLPLIYIKTLIR